MFTDEQIQDAMAELSKIFIASYGTAIKECYLPIEILGEEALDESIAEVLVKAYERATLQCIEVLNGFSELPGFVGNAQWAAASEAMRGSLNTILANATTLNTPYYDRLTLTLTAVNAFQEVKLPSTGGTVGETTLGKALNYLGITLDAAKAIKAAFEGDYSGFWAGFATLGAGIVISGIVAAAATAGALFVGVVAWPFVLLGAGLSYIITEFYHGKLEEFFQNWLGNEEARDITEEYTRFYGGARIHDLDSIRTRVVMGSSDADNLITLDGEPSIMSGGGGNDDLQGADLTDVIFGGVGNDILEGQGGNDRLDGGAGHDTYQFFTADFQNGATQDIIIDSDRDGEITFNGGAVSNFTRDANWVWRTSNNTFRALVTETGTELTLTLIHRVTGSCIVINDWHNGDLGITLDGLGEPGTPENPGLELSNASDVYYSALTAQDLGQINGQLTPEALLARDGDDRISSLGGNDFVDGGYGDDIVHGGDGDDLINGGSGDDELYGDDGNDIIIDTGRLMGLYQNSGAQPTNQQVLEELAWVSSGLSFDNSHPYGDYVAAGGLTSYFTAGYGFFTGVYGAPVADATGLLHSLNLYLGQGNLAVNTGGASGLSGFLHPDPNMYPSGDDTINAGAGSDVVFAGEGNDIIDGGTGNDLLIGGQDNDIIDGGDGDDLIVGDLVHRIENVAPIGLNVSDDGVLEAFSRFDVSSGAEVNGVDVINGGAGNDRLFGMGGNDRITGGTGNDLIFGDDILINDRIYVDNPGNISGDDTLDGGEGDDSIYGGAGGDTLFGGDGNDFLQGDYVSVDPNSFASAHQGIDTIHGGKGNDEIVGGGEGDTIYGDEGDDIINGDSIQLDESFHGNDTIYGGLGNDQIAGQGGNDSIQGNEGNDIILGGKGTDTIDGGDGDDQIDGNEDADIINGGAGNDLILGGEGNDILNGSFGDDQVAGAEGDDQIFGGDGVDQLIGGLGSDTLSGGYGNDLLQGDEGDDNLSGDAGNDQISGNDGNDLLNGGDGDDLLWGQAGDDSIFGGAGDDYLDGGAGPVTDGSGNDELHGGIGNDSLRGADGDDRLFGDEGNDAFIGGAGNDTMDGGAGSDAYRFSAGFGSDTITNLDAVNAGRDYIIFDESIDPSTLIYSNGPNNSLIIQVRDTSDQLVLEGFFSSGANHVIRFANGSVLQQSQLIELMEPADPDTTSRIIQGTPGIDRLSGASGNDTIYGELGNDTLIGYGGDDVIYGGPLENSNTGTDNDSIFGGSGNDTLYGMQGNDLLDGGTGNDQLDGGSGQDNLIGGDGDDTLTGGGYVQVDGVYFNDISGDMLDGGRGNDTLVGGLGVNLYRFDADFGNDTIYLTNAPANSSGFGSEKAILEFGSEISASSISLVRIGNNLVISNGANTITIVGYGGSLATVEFRFDDGTVLSASQLSSLQLVTGTDASEALFGTVLNDVMRGLGGNDILNGEDGNDTLEGGDGSDVLNGGLGNDILNGGTGQDALNGGAGNDTYVFNAGFGNDVIAWGSSNAGETETVVFGAGITLADLHFSYSQSNLHITLQPDGDNLDIQDYFSDTGSNYVLRFADGSSATFDTVRAALLQTTSGDDYITGFGSNDTIDGGAGNDSINGGGGNDHLIGGIGNDYLYGGSGADLLEGGEGNDTIQANGGWESDNSVDNIFGGAGNDLIFGGNGIVHGDEGDDWIEGGANVSGGAGNDQIFSYGAAIDGGAGNDYIEINGSATSTIAFGIGSGIDVLNIQTFGSGTNIIQFGAGIAPENLLFSRSGDYLVIDIIGHTDRLIVPHYFDQQNVMNIDQLHFANGVTWNASDLAANATNVIDPIWVQYGYRQIEYSDTANPYGLDSILLGSGADNNLQGQNGNDYIDGGAGNDVLSGGDGNNIFVFGRGYGHDRLVLTASASNTIQIHGDVLPSQLIIGRSGDELILQIAGTADQITVEGYFATDAGAIGHVVFADGTDWNTEYLFQHTVNLDLTLTGDASDNTLIGGIANDTLIGGDGNDTLIGGDGNDWLDGGAGADRMEGGDGDNTYVVDNVGDQVIDVYADHQWEDGIIDFGDAHGDTVRASIDYTLGVDVENLVLTGTDAINGTGNYVNNNLTGNSAANTLRGENGDDVLDGGGGSDTLMGGYGNDTYLINDANAVIVEESGYSYSGGDSGNDNVISSVNFTLGENVENLTLVGANAINGSGNELDNQLVGNVADNVLNGGQGNDVLIGNAGNDHLMGGEGSDVYRFVRGDGNDVIIDTSADGSSDVDTLYFDNDITGSDVSLSRQGDDLLITINASGGSTLISGYFLATDGGRINAIENIVFADGTVWTPSDIEARMFNQITGTEANNTLNGTAASDSIYGLGGNDTLRGLDGDDILDGGTGNDRLEGGNGNDTLLGGEGNDNLIGGIGSDLMSGGLGNDTYTVDDINDTVIEALDEGTDTVNASVSYTLADNIENLTLTGTDSLDGTGNNLNNRITGNAGSNVLDGAGGNDTLIGGDNSDTLMGGDGIDNLNGGLGADLMLGGLGNDVYTVDNIGDVVTELSGEGIDTVNSSISISLSDNVENLVLTGTAAINGTGNALDNRITGNAANNILDGGAGNDTLVGGTSDDTLIGGEGNDNLNGGIGADVMSGGTGNDIYTVDDMNDVIQELDGEGSDTVNSSISFVLSNALENLTLTGTTAINATGNALDNRLTGNAADNVLDGGDGNDTLSGGDGNDTLLGGAGNDSLNGGLGIDSMTGGVGNDTYTVDNINDTVFESDGEGTDTVNSSVSFVLSNALENLTLTGTSVIDATGNSLDNRLTGNMANNVLDGGDGNDTLSGGDGNDTLLGGAGNDSLNGGLGIDAMTGGAGNDVYTVDNLGDTVVELESEGTDTVNASVSFALSNAIENLTLTGTLAINATGNALDNKLTGNAADNVLDGGDGNDVINAGDGNDTLLGGAGNDTLNGGLGADAMTGGAGNDTYTVDNVGDTVVELDGEGTDTVNSSVDFALSSNFENLTLTGTAVSNGTGNALDNKLTGNAADNILDGGDGTDTINGGAGNDTLLGGAGNDILGGGTGANTLVGGAGNDRLSSDAANSANSIYDGGLGNDTITGGQQNDTYRFNIGDGQDTILDAGLAGYNDVVQFGAGITDSMLVYKRVGNDMVISFTGNTDKITIRNWYVGTANQIEQLSFNDGSQLVWNGTAFVAAAPAPAPAPAFKSQSIAHTESVATITQSINEAATTSNLSTEENTMANLLNAHRFSSQSLQNQMQALHDLIHPNQSGNGGAGHGAEAAPPSSNNQANAIEQFGARLQERLERQALSDAAHRHSFQELSLLIESMSQFGNHNTAVDSSLKPANSETIQPIVIVTPGI